MTILVNIIRILIILLIIRIVVTWIMGVRHSMRTAGAGGARASRRARTMSERAGGTLVRDPNCGTFIPESRAVVAGALRFCSTACRDAYLEKPGFSARGGQGSRVSPGNPVS